MKTLNKSIIFTFFAFLIFGSASVFAQEEAQKINDITNFFGVFLSINRNRAKY